ncbi:type II CRISPR RNA-guided endonuclease Cas9 [Ralstonia solanacearum]|uniref:type II CRISPR RNA-guided endonuclease Cas9 n=3 Tax=Ralstonia solanacearum TaxID=305 RepID=UPI0005038E63|nr:type II CRISPR RNA-guided endonuclease Cas9 [Ralstonia solanacearum]KFX26287.1 hypothetical protein KR96_24710 [Ralstonia solanacearum]
MAEMQYRWGLDIGTNSIGWAVIALIDGRPAGLVVTGSRIFSDGRNPKDGSSLAVERRGPRQMRRRRDRYLRRRDRFMQALIDAGLMPGDAAARKALVTENPYVLRQRGLDQALTLPEFGRALFHLNQRRGFQSNRKTDRASAKESGKVKSAIAAFRASMGSARTVGEALARRLEDGSPVRARMVGQGKDEHYELYIAREWIAQEFDALWASQQRFHAEVLTDAVRDRLRAILLFQRKLLPVPVGKCFLEPNQPRVAAALPSAQRFRLMQELNHLRVMTLADKQERPLSFQERNDLLAQLAARPKCGFDMLRKIVFGANKEAYRFTIESERRKELKGCDTAAKLAKASALGARWQALSLDEQDRLVCLLLDGENDAVLAAALREHYGLTDAQIDTLLGLSFEDGHMRLGRPALRRVLDALERGRDEQGLPLSYDKAVVAAGYPAHTADLENGERDALPYYGEVLWRYTQDAPTAKNDAERKFGKIANPTVHIGLNQLRKLVNALIQRYGKPAQIVVELARNLKAGLEEKERIKKQQTADLERNERIRQKLQDAGVPDNRENRLRMRLFEELGQGNGLGTSCIYSGRQISLQRLFSNDVQVDHILPFSKTLDDSFANKVLAQHDANRYKGNRGPFEAFGANRDGYVWDEIRTRAAVLPRNKRNRFAETAMQDWLHNEADFLARQLTDTAYLSRVARQYLTAICPKDDVYASPGRLTAMLRAKWGLNRVLDGVAEAQGRLAVKNRDDHRHHAIDAVVIGATDRAMLQQVATLAARAREQDAERLIGDMPTPWPNFLADVRAAVARCVVSHKPDHGPEGGLHKDTAYGIVEGPREDGLYRVQHRVSLFDITPENLSKVDCDAPLRAELDLIFKQDDVKARVAALTVLAERYGQRKVRLVEWMSVLPIRPRGDDGKTLPDSAPYKAYSGGSNYCYELFINERGRWDGELISTFRANQAAYRRFRNDPARFRRYTAGGRPLLMRLCINDYIAVGTAAERTIFRVVKMSENKITLAEHFEGGTLKQRDADKDDPFKYLTKSPGALRDLGARRIFVDLIGRVLDPGIKGD